MARGEGELRFYPIYALGDVWRDAEERVLLCLDPELLDRDRYLRDRFAVGPTIVSCQTHALGNIDLYRSLARLKDAPKFQFDLIVCISTVAKDSLEKTFATYLRTRDGLPPCSLTVIPNPIDPERFRPYVGEEKVNARSCRVSRRKPRSLYAWRG